jgi:hypothetical protein
VWVAGDEGADSLRARTARQNAHALVVPADTPVVPSSPAARADGGLVLSIHLATSASSEAPAPGELHLVRADGRAVGYLPDRGASHDIPGATYDSAATHDETPNPPGSSDAIDQRLIAGVPADTGTYVLTVSGVANGAYTLTARVDSGSSDFVAEQRLSDVPIIRGARHRYRVTITQAAVTIERMP